MKKEFTVFLPILVLAIGCTTTKVSNQRDGKFVAQINRHGQHRTATIVTLDAVKLKGRMVQIRADSVILLDRTKRTLQNEADLVRTFNDAGVVRRRIAADQIRGTQFESGTATLVTKNGETVRGRDLRVEGDSVSFLDITSSASLTGNYLASEGQQPVSYSLSANSVRRIEFTSRGRGLLEGLGLGVLGGFTIGFVYGAIDHNNICGSFLGPSCSHRANSGVFVGAILSVMSLPLGSIIGAIVGHRYRFEFNHPPYYGR